MYRPCVTVVMVFCVDFVGCLVQVCCTMFRRLSVCPSSGESNEGFQVNLVILEQIRIFTYTEILRKIYDASF